MVLGKFHKLIDSKETNTFIAIPFLDRIEYVIDMREKAIVIHNQTAMTKDNIRIGISCVVYCNIVDAQKAAYSSINPLYSMRQHTQTAIRAVIAELEFEQVLENQAHLGDAFKVAIQEMANFWGFAVNKCEVSDISPNKEVSDALLKQAAEERERKNLQLEAENRKIVADIEASAETIRVQRERYESEINIDILLT